MPNIDEFYFLDEDELDLNVEEEEEEDEDEDEEDEEEEEDTEQEENDEDYVPHMATVSRLTPNRLNPSRRIVFEEGEAQIPSQHTSDNAEEILEEIVEYVRRREEGEASSSSSSKRIESEGTVTRRESNGNEIEGACCPICMEPWSSEAGHQVSCLPCGHVYGLSCIERWIRQCRKNHAKCPQCGRKCSLKDIIKLYVSRIIVADGEQQKKLLSLQAENEILKMKIANFHDKILQDKEDKMHKEKEKVTHLENVTLGESQSRPSEFISWMGGSQGQKLSRHTFGSNFCEQGSSFCRFALEDELVVDGARIFDMDTSSQILILARRLSGMGGTHVLTKMSLMYPYESENIHLPSNTKAIRDLRFSPSSGRLVLFASLGKKLSILSTESNNIVLTYDLPAPAWSCSWDLNSPHHVYSGLQNGTLLVFDMRQTSEPMESISGLTCHPVHTIHSLVQNSHVSDGVRTLISASSIGPCVWNASGIGQRPFLVPEMENQGVCISLAYSCLSDDIVASFRPKIQASNDVVDSQSSLSLSPSPTVLGRGILGSHVLIKRVGGSSYQKLGSTSANVNDVRMPKSAIVNVDNCNPFFAYGDEVTRGLSLRELPSLRVIQNLKPHQHPILDVKYLPSLGTGLLGCVSEDRLQLFSAKLS